MPSLQLPGLEKIPEALQDISSDKDIEGNTHFSKYTLDSLNPNPREPTTPADIINLILPFLFVIAGIVLFFMFIVGGFTIFTSVGNPEKIKKGTSIITNAVIGFIIMFSAYWIIQIIQTMLGITLL